VCGATSGPGEIHLLNGLDHVPVVAIVGQTDRSAMGGSYQQEVDLLTLFKDVCRDYVQITTELPLLLAALSSRLWPFDRVVYDENVWAPAPLHLGFRWQRRDPRPLS
jgi:hypothetical protein